MNRRKHHQQLGLADFGIVPRLPGTYKDPGVVWDLAAESWHLKHGRAGLAQLDCYCCGTHRGELVPYYGRKFSEKQARMMAHFYECPAHRWPEGHNHGEPHMHVTLWRLTRDGQENPYDRIKLWPPSG